MHLRSPLHDRVKVIRVKDGGTYEEDGWSVVYVGRPGPLGNPYRLDDYGGEAGRYRVIHLFRLYLDGGDDMRARRMRREIDRLARRLINGERIALSCYCAPLACHGDVICEHLLYVARGLLTDPFPNPVPDPESDYR